MKLSPLFWYVYGRLIESEALETETQNQEQCAYKQHGEINTIQHFFALPSSARPTPDECVFYATHEPCSLCESVAPSVSIKTDNRPLRYRLERLRQCILPVHTYRDQVFFRDPARHSHSRGGFQSRRSGRDGRAIPCETLLQQAERFPHIHIDQRAWLSAGRRRQGASIGQSPEDQADVR